MNIDYWIKIFDLAYKNGESIDLILGEKKQINLVFDDEKISFLTQKFSNEIFSKVEEEHLPTIKAGEISLLQLHYMNNKVIFSQQQHRIIKEAADIMLGFFYKQIDDEYSFGDINRISEIGALGKTIEEKYSISEGPFLKLAETYWTFKIELSDLKAKYLFYPLTQILIQIEASFASYFFPLMTPFRPNPYDIYEAQKEFLTKYTNKFNIERFLSESPILKNFKKPMPTKKLDLIDGVLYLRDTKIPFDGPAVTEFSGMKLVGILKKGKPDGKWYVLYPNGKKYMERNYKDGELIDSTIWDKDGNKQPPDIE